MSRQQSWNLDGRTAVITGISRGIGRATALQLAEAGADIAGLYLGDESDAATLGAELDDLGRRSYLVQGDAGDSAVHSALAAGVVERWGRLDIWVNNAARLMVKPILETTDEDWHGLLAANLHGYFYGCRAAASVMSVAGRGRIINVTSAARILPIADLSAYVTAKAGVLGLTQVLAIELAKQGVTVNAVAPGAIDTTMNADAYTDAVRETYNERIPAGYIGHASQIAEAVLFIASDASSYMTGQELVVDGGLTINGSVGHARSTE